MAVDGGEPKSCHTGCFAAPTYRIMTENPPYRPKLGMADSLKTATNISHG